MIMSIVQSSIDYVLYSGDLNRKIVNFFVLDLENPFP